MIITSQIALVLLVPIAVSILSVLISKSCLETAEDNNRLIKIEDAGVLKYNESVCSTSACNASAASILKKLDVTIDPCENFYNFACGNFIKNTVIPEERPMEMLFTIMQEKLTLQMKGLLEAPIVNDEIKPFQYLKQFYQKCINQSEVELHSISSLRNIINQIGNWPILQGNQWNSSRFDVYNVTYRLRQLGLPSDQLISVYVDANRNTSDNILYIERPEFSMDSKYLTQGLNNSRVKAYLDYIVNISVALGAEKSVSMKDFNDSMLFEIQLANVTDANLAITNLSESYTTVSIKKLNEKYPFIPWVDYINHLIANEHVQIDSNETVSVKEIEFLPGLENLLNVTPKRVQANYILSRILSEFAPYLSAEIQNFTLEYNRIAYGVIENPLRWKHCMLNIPDGLERVAGALYVRTFFDPNTKLKAIELVKNLKSTFIDIINSTRWMDNATKLIAVEKAKVMDANVAYPDELLDDHILENFYKNLTISPNDSLLDYILKVYKFEKNVNFINLRKPLNKTYWVDQMPAETLNAQYSQDRNSINVAAVLLQDESYNINRPEYMNYARIGFVIGHEIVHGFDNKGRKFDKNGKVNDWWEPSTATEYVKKAKCIIDQYNNYTVPKLNLHLNGKNTLGENIADNGAAKVAYLAYQHWINKNGVEKLLPGVNYTPNQLFWISCAQYFCSVETDEYLKDIILVDHHAPMEFRVIGSFSNSEHFARDFNCSLGSNMNPPNKCQIW